MYPCEAARLSGDRSPGGQLVVTVPNVASLGSRRCLARHGVLLDNWVEHRQHFNLRGLDRLLTNQGFTAIRMTSDFIGVPRIGLGASGHLGRRWILRMLARLADRYPQLDIHSS